MRKFRYFGQSFANGGIAKTRFSSIPHRKISTLHHFPENNAIKHFVVTRNPGESNDSLFKQMLDIVDDHPDSLIIVVERSLILKRDSKGGYTDIVRSKDEIFELLMSSDSKSKLRPHEGHMSAILTKSNKGTGNNIEISLRPGKIAHVTGGQSTMHEHLYGKMPNAIFESSYPSAEEEFKLLSINIGKGKGHIRADITVVPLALCNISREELIQNTEKLFNNRLYHLCMSIYKKEKIDEVTDQIVQEQIRKLILAAEKLNSNSQTNLDKDFIAAAALACTHGIVQAIFADYYHIEKKYGPDLDVQSVSTYITMALTGYINFRQFAKEIGLIEISSDFIESSSSVFNKT